MAQVKETASLGELERWLRFILTEPRGVAAALAHPRADEPKPRCLNFIADRPPLPREARLDVYAEAYFSRLVEALAKDFEAIYRIVGEEDFRYLIANYLVVHPSHSPTIAEAGHHLSSFIQTHTLIDRFPFLAELAEFEWLMIEAFYADNVPVFDLSTVRELSQDAWPSSRLRLHPSMRLNTSKWPVDELQKGGTVPSTATSTPADHRFLIYRNLQHVVTTETLSFDQWRLLKKMGDSLPLSDCLSDFPADLSNSVQGWFQTWIQTGLICGIEVDLHSLVD